MASKAKAKKVQRFGAFGGVPGWTITELQKIVSQSNQEQSGVDALCGDEAAGACIIRDLLSEVRRLKTELATARSSNADHVTE